MAGKLRDVVTIGMIFLMAGAAFAAGYLFNDVREARLAAAPTLTEGDFAVFWEALQRIEQSYIGEMPTSRQITYGAIRGALNALNDPYTVFIEPVAREQERDSLRGNFGGIGATVQRDEDGRFILTPIPGNPAELAGVLSGDILIAVDGFTITAEMSVEEVVQRIRGEKGTRVRLTLLHEGDSTPITVEIERGDILIPSVTARLLAEDATIGYIRLERFSGESSREVGEAILNLRQQGATRLIVDIRHNGGGLLDAAVAVADHFLHDGVILLQRSKLETERVFQATATTAAGDLPVVVLIDAGTASAAEIVAGALQDRQRAVLIGTRTFGKGSVQLVYDLSDGSSVHVTSARWFTPAGRQLDQEGLAPDIEMQPTPEATADGRDEVLQRAIAYLQNGQ
jgi:carboxyl-terminal processing protease